MATLSTSGDNSSYTITLSGMSTRVYYYVYVADLSTTGAVNGYKCVRASLGTSSSWSTSGKSNSPYSNYSRSVYVYTSDTAVSRSEGTTYTWDQMRKSCTFMDSKTIPPAGGGGGSKILTVGSWPSILSSVSVTSGTFTSDNTAITFSKDQDIESIQLTTTAKSNYWTGTLYWGTSSGSTTYKIATIRGGSITYEKSIESINYSGSSRSIYFTAVGSYCYRVRYNANGGTFSSTTANFRDDFVEQTNNEYSYAGTFSNDISRSGYRLLGWGKTSTETSATYGTTASIGPITSKSINLYAIWASNTCTLTFDYNGGRYAESTGPDTIPVTYGTTFTIHRVPSKSGYDFLGWRRTANGLKYYDGDSFIISNQKEILTAQWGNRVYFQIAAQSEGIASYTVHFTAQKEYTWSNKTYDISHSVLVDDDETVYIEVTLKNIPETGKLVNANGFEVPIVTAYKDTALTGATRYTLKLTSGGEGSALKQPEYLPLSITAAIRNGWHYFSITAQPKYYTATLYANGGTWGANQKNPQTKAVKSTVQLDLSEFTPTRAGYNLYKWDLNPANSGIYNTDHKRYLLDDITLYAIWQKKSIDKFYWYTNDIQDNTYIAEGKPITNLKASAWNRLKDKIEEVSEATNTNLPSSYSPTRVDSTTEISAKDYNGVRLAIVNFPGAGTGPAVAAKDMVIGASMFVGKNSLKDAINRAIDTWNNS